MIQNIAAGTANFNILLKSEFDSLSNIDNNYQIRHFEKGKIPINEINHIDYLFYKMIALISLCLNELNVGD